MEGFAGELTCSEVVELVTDYLEGELQPRKRMVLEQHLLICQGCEAYLRQTRHTVWLLSLLHEDLTEFTPSEALLHRFRRWRANRLRDGDGPLQ